MKKYYGVAAMTGLLLMGMTGRAQESMVPVMNSVFNDIAFILRADLGPDPTGMDNEAEIQARLQSLQDAAQSIDEHVQGRAASFQLISRSFEDSVNRLAAWYDHSQPEYSIYYLLDITQNCVACHAKLPSETNFRLGEDLLDSIDLTQLDPLEVAQLEVAVRQFDSARVTWESFFSDRQLDPVYFGYEDALIDYLLVNLQVFQDVERPTRTMTDLLTRDDVPYYLKRHLYMWIAHLSDLEAEIQGEPNLENIRALYQRSNEMTDIPVGRDRVVYDVAVSALLNRLVETNTELAPAELSEIWYMLGVIDLRLRRGSRALPEAELLFESAIRAAPEEDTARRAYALLEEYTLYSLDQSLGGLNDGPVPLGELGELVGIDSESGE